MAKSAQPVYRDSLSPTEVFEVRDLSAASDLPV
jgi:hypothetical protein